MASSDNHTGAALADATSLSIRNKVNGQHKAIRAKDYREATKTQRHSATSTGALLTFCIEFGFVVKATIKDSDHSAPHPMNPFAILTIDRCDPKGEEIVTKFVYDAKQKDVNVNCSYVLHQSIKSVLRENRVKCIDPSWNTQISTGWWNKNDTSIRLLGSIDDDNWNQNDLPDYKFAYYGVEVVSPILSATSEGLDQAKKVADLLDTVP